MGCSEWATNGVAVGARARLPVDCGNMCVRRAVRAAARAAVGAGAPLSVELVNSGMGRQGRSPGSGAMGAGARLPVGLDHLHVRH